MEQRLRAGRLKITGLFEDVRVVRVPVDDIERFADPDVAFMNLNTPGDLARALALWERQREVATLAAVLATGGANLLNQARHLYLSLEQTVLAAGLPWMAVGLGVVLLALGISLLKMGVWQGARGWLARANLALGGEGPASA